jgi:hypothetical protein
MGFIGNCFLCPSASADVWQDDRVMAAGIRTSTTTDWLPNSRGRKNVHAKRVRGDRRGHARGLFQSICAVHLVLLSMSDRCRIALRLPPASVGAAIYVEYLSSYLIGLRQIENSVDDIFYLYDFPHWLQLFERLFGLILMQR